MQVAARHPAGRNVDSRWARCRTADTAAARPAARESGSRADSRDRRPTCRLGSIFTSPCSRILPTQAAMQRVSAGCAGRAERRVLALDPREAADALLAGPGRGPIHRLLVRAPFDALAIAAAAALDRSGRCRPRAACRSPAADTRPGSRDRCSDCRSGPGGRTRPCARATGPSRRTVHLVELPAGGRVFVDVGMPPFVVGRQVAEGGLRSFGAGVLLGGLEDRHPLEGAVGLLLGVRLGGVPDLLARVGLLRACSAACCPSVCG